MLYSIYHKVSSDFVSIALLQKAHHTHLSFSDLHCILFLLQRLLSASLGPGLQVLDENGQQLLIDLTKFFYLVIVVIPLQ